MNSSWYFPPVSASFPEEECIVMPSVSVSDKYFSLVAGRECGECMMCCQYLYINSPTLKKPADVLCAHCVLSSGCGIYETRPNVCRTWHCLWRRVESMPENLRPDKANVLFSLKISYEPRHFFENAYIVCIALTDPAAFDSHAVSQTLDMFISQGNLPVWLSYGGGKSLAWPGKELADAILHPVTTEHKHLVEEGMAWRHRYDDMQHALQFQHSVFGREFVTI